MSDLRNLLFPDPFMEDHPFGDPLWQLVLYIGLNPLFRLMHVDKNNIVSWLLGVLGMANLWYVNNGVYAFCFGMVGLLVFLIKHYLVCGPMYKVYSDRSYGHSKLDTSGDVPTLYLNSATTFDNGFEYGTIMAEEIIHLIRRFKTITRCHIPMWLLRNIDSHLPENIKHEMRGMHVAIESTHRGDVTYWDILTIQLIPELDNMGCTCYAARDCNGKVILGRNMDWLPFSSAQYSIIVCYRKYGYKSLVVPGLIGCVTAWKDDFALAMNVVNSDYELNTERLPSTLFNKMIMMKSTTYDDATVLASQEYPSAPYHLTIAGVDDVQCFSYYQASQEDHKDQIETYVRRLSGQDTNLSVLNWTYPGNQNGRHISDYRNDRTTNLTDTGYKHVADILRQCQTFETMHSVIFDFSGKVLETSIKVDNGFAADQI